MELILSLTTSLRIDEFLFCLTGGHFHASGSGGTAAGGLGQHVCSQQQQARAQGETLGPQRSRRVQR